MLMLNKLKNQITPLLFFICIVVCFSGCFLQQQQSFDINSITSYREIPGITDEEIEAIEVFKAAGRSFSYGSILSPEAFISHDGSYTGFSALLCERLTELFDIPFVTQTFGWEVLKSGIDSKKIDFTGELTPTQERREFYFMSHSIAERSLAIFTHGQDDRFDIESDINGLKIGFYAGTITAQSIMNVYPELHFEVVEFLNNIEIAESLISGRIDVFVTDDVAVFEFKDFPSIHSKAFFHLIYTPVSMVTANPDLKPIITIVDKYIEAGGIDDLYNFYKTGRLEYARYELGKSFSEEETAYIAALSASGKKVYVALEYDHYPICFFNNKDGEFQGIAVDMLKEISLLTGLEFYNVTDKDTPFYKILEMLDAGEVSLVSELILTPERKDKYLWSDRYYSSYFALISKINFSHLTISQVVRARVGVSKGTAYEERYKAWFPDYTNLVYYDSSIDAMFALDRDEVDLVMASENALMSMINYFENPGYMINIRFNALEESYFGFNIQEEELCSIIKKTQNYIDNERIVRYWTSRVFDYSRKHMEERLFIFFISAALLFLMLILLGILFVKNNKMRVLYKNQMITLSAMFNALPDLVFCKDVSGRITNCNRSYQEFTGLSESEIIGKTGEEIYTNNDKLIIRGKETDKKVLDNKTYMKVEEMAIYPDGSRKIFEMIKTPLIDENKTTGLLGIMRDITEHKTAMEAVHEANERFRIMLDTTPLICNLWNREYKVFDCNDAAPKLFNLDKQTYIEKFLELAPEYQPDGQLTADKARKLLDTAFMDGICVFEWMNQTLDGSLIPMEVTLTRVVYEGNFVAVGYGRDLREQKRMAAQLEIAVEEARGANKAKSNFLAQMSHEIRTPLNAITGMTSIGKSAGTTERMMYCLDKIEDASKHLMGVINDILDMTKIEANKLELSSADFIFEKVIERVVNVISFRVEEKNQKLSINIDSIIPKTLFGDDQRLAQVITNLMSNAVKFTPENGSISFDAQFLGEADGVCTIQFVIKDSGIGISAEQQAHLFEPFHQAESSTTRKYGGTGLGLSISKSIIQLMDGAIWLDSEPGAGSTFKFTIKMERSADGNNDTVPSHETIPDMEAAFTGRHILLVEDVEINREIVIALLEPTSLKISCAENGVKAVSMFRQSADQYDLILMDVQMPEMDGYEATRTIRAMDLPNAKTVPIIAMTANVFREDVQRCLEAGMNNHIGKPINNDEMMAKLYVYLFK